ncbi:protein kinase [Sorangium cellulosum]|uniref:Protein kinase n=1 Tax=Sorangium cellulosum TaxID=56 RepID=A0A4P2R0H7_SORCE|nr:protein kinase [Sorangium cellulosum]WCQ95706.1 serine-threonine kinase [Sorangium sp. Soce836]
MAQGEVLAGKYRIERVLGRGGMGVVVAAEQLQLGRRVAIKFLLSQARAEQLARFRREARAVARLSSHHVARVVDVDQLPTGTPYMVMEYLDGSDLSDLLKKRGQLGIVEVIDYVLQAAEAIAEAHANGIIHRDLKPANLFISTSADGSPIIKVLDFGISKEVPSAVGTGPDMGLTSTTTILGSPLYMSPEQFRSTRTVDHRTDIWSLGAIIYQLLSGRVPFAASTLPQLVLMLISTEMPPLLSAFRSDVPAALEAAILQCLERDPALRFQNVAELAAAIAPYGSASALASAERIARTLGAPAAPPVATPTPSDGPPGAAPLSPSARLTFAREIAHDVPRWLRALVAFSAAAGVAIVVTLMRTVPMQSEAPAPPAASVAAAAAPAPTGDEQIPAPQSIPSLPPMREPIREALPADPAPSASATSAAATGAAFKRPAAKNPSGPGTSQPKPDELAPGESTAQERTDSGAAKGGLVHMIVH